MISRSPQPPPCGHCAATRQRYMKNEWMVVCNGTSRARMDFKLLNWILGSGLIKVKVGDGPSVHAQRKGQNYSSIHHVSCHCRMDIRDRARSARSVVRLPAWHCWRSARMQRWICTPRKPQGGGVCAGNQRQSARAYHRRRQLPGRRRATKPTHHRRKRSSICNALPRIRCRCGGGRHQGGYGSRGRAVKIQDNARDKQNTWMVGKAEALEFDIDSIGSDLRHGLSRGNPAIRTINAGLWRWLREWTSSLMLVGCYLC